MATVEIIPSKGTCQHVQVKITVGKETRSYSLLREELVGEQDVDKQFEAVLANLKTNIKLSGTRDFSVLTANLTGKEFKV
jgi:hypothetical protein